MRRRNLVDDIVHDLPHVHIGTNDWDAAAETAPREVEQSPDHLVHTLGTSGDPRRERQVWFFELLRLEHEFGRHHDSPEGRPKIMTQDREEHFLRLIEVLRVPRN